MAFGIKRDELRHWKEKVANGDVAFLTHYWLHPEFPQYHTVTKVGCIDLNRLIAWGHAYNLKANWIDEHPGYPHFDLIGHKQKEVLLNEHLTSHIERFHIE